jgi:hypothetical protein
MPFNSSSYKKSRDLNDRNYILDLFAETKLYLRSRLYNRNRKVRSCTLFFRLNGTLLINGFIREKVKSIPIREIT